MSKKLIPFCCVKPLTTNLALYLSTVPSGRSFFLKIHLQPTDLHPGGRSVRIQVLSSIMDLISLLMTSFQKGDSEEFIVNLTLEVAHLTLVNELDS